MTRLPDTTTIIDNLAAIRATATAEHVQEGRTWYPNTLDAIRRISSEAAHATGDYATPDPLAAGIFAAYSQNATWKANVTMASNYMRGIVRGMTRVLAECDALENGADPTDYAVLGLKRADFCANILGDPSRVTCDRWHLRAAYDRPKPPTLTAKVHADVTAATRIVADWYGDTPAECQAIIWCAVRGDGK